MDIYREIALELKTHNKARKYINLKNVSPKLSKIKNSVVFVPGAFEPRKPAIFIQRFF